MPPRPKRGSEPATPEGAGSSELGSPAGIAGGSPPAQASASRVDASAPANAPSGADAPPAWAQQLVAALPQITARLERLESVRPILPEGTYSSPAGAPSAPADNGSDAAVAADGAEAADDVEYVPDVGVNNPHARAVYAGGDTYLRPQRFNMHRDGTFDSLKSKPKGTLFEAYSTLEPSLRYLFNVVEYCDRLSAVESSLDPDELPIHLERVRNSVAGVYGLINKYVGLIHLRATYGDNPTEREKLKLEHVRDCLAQADFLPASLDERIRELCEDFDSAYDAQRRTALAKKAAGSFSADRGRGDDPPDGESKKQLQEAPRARAQARAPPGPPPPPSDS